MVDINIKEYKKNIKGYKNIKEYKNIKTYNYLSTMAKFTFSIFAFLSINTFK